VRQPPPTALESIAALISPLLHPLMTTGVVVIFVIFTLLQREDLRNRLIKLAGSHDLQKTTAAMDDAASVESGKCAGDADGGAKEDRHVPWLAQHGRHQFAVLRVGQPLGGGAGPDGVVSRRVPHERCSYTVRPPASRSP